MNVVIPAPEIPPRISKGGSQHQLDAMNADSNAPKLAKPWARPDGALSLFIGGFAAHCDVEVDDAQQSGAAVVSCSSSAMLLILFHFRGESMGFDGLRHLIDCDLAWVVTHEQHIQVFIRFNFAFPLVFN